MFNIFNNEVELGIGIDIGYNSIKVVELKKEKNQIEINNYAEIELSAYAGLELGQSADIGMEKKIQALVDVFRSANFSVRNAYVSIPSIESYLFTIDVKSVTGIELNNLVELEIRKYIPIPASELIIDHWPISQDGAAGALRLSVIAVKKSVVDQYISIFKKAEINILGFEMETFSAVRSLGLSDKNYLLVESGGSYTVVTLISKGVLYKSQTIQIGGNNITSVLKNSLMKGSYKEIELQKRQLINKEIEDTALMNIMDMTTYPLLEEIGHIGENMERGYNLSIDEVVFVGGNARALISNLRLTECFKANVRLGQGFKSMKYPEYLSEMMGRVGTTYEVAAGLALKSFIKNESK